MLFIALSRKQSYIYLIKDHNFVKENQANYMKVVVQKIHSKVDSDIDKAIKYYSIIFALNNIRIPQKQIYLLAYTAARGSITSPAARAEFVKMFDSSLASLENMKQELVKAGLLVKIDKKYKINPKLALNFSNTVVLQINLIGSGEKENS